MSKETPEQKKMRERYEKLYDDAMARGPVKFEDMGDTMKDWYAWKYCQIAHVEDAVGGFANFRYFITEHGEAYFKSEEKLRERINELEKIEQDVLNDLVAQGIRYEKLNQEKMRADDRVEKLEEALRECRNIFKQYDLYCQNERVAQFIDGALEEQEK